MPRFANFAPVLALSSLAILSYSPAGLAQQDDDFVTSKVKTAWEKFSDMQEVLESAGVRGEIMSRQLYLDRYRADLQQTIDTMQIEVNSWRVPHSRFNNIQAEYVDNLQAHRAEMVATRRELDELNLQWRQLNDEAIKRAHARGEQVKPLDRVGLTNKMEASKKKSLEAFSEAKDAIFSRSAKPEIRLQQLDSAISQLKAAGADAGLVPSEKFKRAFIDYSRTAMPTSRKQSRRR